MAGRVDLEPYLWEHEPMHAGSDFQKQIPPPSEYHVFVGILWSRLGSRLHSQHARADGTRYLSGTEYEFETALEAYRRSANKTPRILIYRCKEVPSFPAEPREIHEARQQQWEALKHFIEHWFTDVEDGGTFKAAFNVYADVADFEERLEPHLRKVVEELSGEPGPSVETAAAIWQAGSPYRGLKVFEYVHSPIFFGRTRAIGQVISQLRDRANNDERCPFVLILGGSGSGKSSLLRAGVMPTLAAGGVDGIGLWRRALMQPSQTAGDLFDGLAAALLQPDAVPELSAGGLTAERLSAMLRENAGSIGLLLTGTLPQVAGREHEAEKQRLRESADTYASDGRRADADYARRLIEELRFPEPRLILGIDQMEEIFTHSERFTVENRTQFVRALASLARCNYVWIAATLRSDFFARCEELPDLVKLKSGKGQFHLLPPNGAELGQMIRLPAQAAGVSFEDDPSRGRLDDALRDAAINDPHSLPLLEFTLEQFFEAGTARRRLRHADYDQLGGSQSAGLRGVLVKAADEIWNGLSATGKRSFPVVFRRLATIGAAESEAGPRFSRTVDKGVLHVDLCEVI